MQSWSITPEFWRKFDNRTLLQTSVWLSSVWRWWVFFNTNWTNIFLTQFWNWWRIYESSLNSPYDLSSIDFSKYITLANAEDIHFSPDWKNMFILKNDTSPLWIYKYTLSTARDIWTATLSQTITWRPSSDRWMYITPDWKTIYIWSSWWILYRATMSTARDLSTLSSFTTISSTLWWFWIRFWKDWHILLNSIENSSVINYHILSTAYDINTITENWTLSITKNNAWWMRFNDSWTFWVIVWWWDATNYVKKYSL